MDYTAVSNPSPSNELSKVANVTAAPGVSTTVVSITMMPGNGTTVVDVNGTTVVNVNTADMNMNSTDMNMNNSGAALNSSGPTVTTTVATLDIVCQVLVASGCPPDNSSVCASDLISYDSL